MRPAAEIDTCHSSHRRLVDALARLSDDDLRSPSSLPGYSRGHVVSHLINKATAHVSLFDGASAGEVRQLHPDGYDADVAAEVGAGRSAAALRSDLENAFEQLESAWELLGEELWDRQAIMTAGPRTMAEIVVHHLRNVEVHHVDLDTGYRPADWPSYFVDGELPKRLRWLEDRANHADLLAWLLGRAPAPELGPW